VFSLSQTQSATRYASAKNHFVRHNRPDIILVGELFVRWLASFVALSVCSVLFVLFVYITGFVVLLAL